MKAMTLDDLRGWHLVCAVSISRTHYQIFITKRANGGGVSRYEWCHKSVITTARELGYLTRNGYTLP